MRIVEEKIGGVTVLQPGERIDVATAPELKAATQRVLGEGVQRLVIDLSRVEYVSSVGIGALLAAAKQAQALGGRVALAAVAPQVREVCELTGVLEFFTVHGDREDAVEALGRRAALTLPEEVLLLVLEEEGGFLDLPDHALEHALAGAALLELSHRGRVDGDLSTVQVLDASAMGDEVLDPALQALGSLTPPHETSPSLRALVAAAPAMRRAALERLVAHGILGEKNGLVSWLGGKRRYPVVDGAEQQEVRARILDLLRSDRIPGPRDVAIVALADACAVFDALLDMDEMLDLRDRIAEVARLDLFALAIRDALRAVQRRGRDEAADGQPAR